MIPSDDGWALRLFIAADGLRRAPDVTQLKAAVCDAVVNMCGSEKFGVWLDISDKSVTWIDCDVSGAVVGTIGTDGEVPPLPPRSWAEDAWQRKTGLKALTLDAHGAVVPVRLGAQTVGALVVREWLPQVKDTPDRLLDALSFVVVELESALMRLLWKRLENAERDNLVEQFRRLIMN